MTETVTTGSYVFVPSKAWYPSSTIIVFLSGSPVGASGDRSISFMATSSPSV